MVGFSEVVEMGGEVDPDDELCCCHDDDEDAVDVDVLVDFVSEVSGGFEGDVEKETAFEEFIPNSYRTKVITSQQKFSKLANFSQIPKKLII